MDIHQTKKCGMTRKWGVVKAVLLTDIFLGIIVAAWSRWRWNECGYDCGLFGIESGPASVVGWYVGVAIAAISIIVLVVIHKRSQ
jgi:hypothetical protein